MALLISVHRSAADRSLYEATRYAWKIDTRKAKQAEVILATTQGVIVGAFIAHDWLSATTANLPGRAEGDGVPGRFGFVGEEAPEEMNPRAAPAGLRCAETAVCGDLHLGSRS